MADEKLRKAAVSFRESLMALVTDATAFVRVLDEIIEAHEAETERPPPEPNMEPVAVEIVKLRPPRRPR